VRRAFRNRRFKCPKTEGSIRAVPLQAIALDALEHLRADIAWTLHHEAVATAANGNR